MSTISELLLPSRSGLPSSNEKRVAGRRPSKLDDILKDDVSLLLDLDSTIQSKSTISTHSNHNGSRNNSIKSTTTRNNSIKSTTTRNNSIKSIPTTEKSKRKNIKEKDVSRSVPTKPKRKVRQKKRNSFSDSDQKPSSCKSFDRGSSSHSTSEKLMELALEPLGREAPPLTNGSSHSNGKRRNSGSTKRRNSLVDTFFTASLTDQSQSTADTEPSTPSTLKMTLDLSRQLMGFEANIDVATMPTNLPPLSEEGEVPSNGVTKKQESKARKEAKREAKKHKEQKKKAKKEKKKKDKNKAKKPKKKGTLSKHLGGSTRSVGSFGSQRSFGSASLGSYVSERSFGESFVSFIQNDCRDAEENEDVGRLGIRKRAMPKGSRKVPLVTMPEHTGSPDASRKRFNDSRKVPLVTMPEHTGSPDVSRKGFNDNADRFNNSFSSFASFNTSFRKSKTQDATPQVPLQMDAPFQSPQKQQLAPLPQALTPTAVTESPGSSTGAAVPRMQMIPKSQSFSYRGSRRSPLQDKHQSAPSFCEAMKRATSVRRLGSSSSFSNKGFPKAKIAKSPSSSQKGSDHSRTHCDVPLIARQHLPMNNIVPMTKFCSAPKATHPNQSVGKAWESPFETETKYLNAEEEYFEPLTGRHSGSSSNHSSVIVNQQMPPPSKPNASASKLKAAAARKQQQQQQRIEEEGEDNSEHSEIDDPWENYAPSALKRNSMNFDGHSSDDLTAISALTMSMRTETEIGPDGRGISPNPGRGGRCWGEKQQGSPRESPQQTNRKGGEGVRPRSPTPPRSPIQEQVSKKDKSVSQFLELHNCNSNETSGEEGSMSLHDASVREEPIYKGKRGQKNRLQKQVSNVSRCSTPPRIRFGEGSDGSINNNKDQSPSMPSRFPSRHARAGGASSAEVGADHSNSHSNGDDKNMPGIPVAPSLFGQKVIQEEESEDEDNESSSVEDDVMEETMAALRRSVQALQSDIEKSQSNHKDRRDDTISEHSKKSDHNSFHSKKSDHSKKSSDHSKKSCDHSTKKSTLPKSNLKITPKLDKPKERNEDDGNNPRGRVSSMIRNYESLEGSTIPIRSPSPSYHSQRSTRSQSPSFHKRRPKNLKPIPVENLNVPMTCRSPSLPPPDMPRKEMLRNASGPLLPGLCKKDALDRDASDRSDVPPAFAAANRAYNGPRTPTTPVGGRTKMSVKAMKSPIPFDTSAHSATKERMQGASSDWTGSPKKTIRDASYHKDENKSENATVKQVRKHGESPIRRRRSNESTVKSISAHSKSLSDHNKHRPERAQRRRSSTKSKQERRRSNESSIKTMSSHEKPEKAERRRSTGNSGKKTERRRSNERDKAERRRSNDSNARAHHQRSQPSSRRRSRTPDKQILSDSGKVPPAFKSTMSPRKVKPASWKKKNDVGVSSPSPRKGKPRSWTRRSKEGKEKGATEGLKSSTTKTPLQRVKRFGKGLLGMTPNSPGDQGGGKVKANKSEMPHLPLTPHSPRKRNASISPSRSIRSASRSRSPHQMRTKNSPIPPPPKQAFFSKARLKERLYLNDRGHEWGGEKAKLQRKREKDMKKAKQKAEEDLQQ